MKLTVVASQMVVELTGRYFFKLIFSGSLGNLKILELYWVLTCCRVKLELQFLLKMEDPRVSFCLI